MSPSRRLACEAIELWAGDTGCDRSGYYPVYNSSRSPMDQSASSCVEFSPHRVLLTLGLHGHWWCQR